jgi:hypothetical protein
MYQLPGLVICKQADGSVEIEVYKGNDSYLFTVSPEEPIYWDCRDCEVGEHVKCAVKFKGTRARLIAIA